MLDPIHVFDSIERTTLGEFDRVFTTFDRTAFRLELLPEYAVPSEAAALRCYENGQPLPTDFNNEWLLFLDDVTSKGKSITRCRYVGNLPSSYINFELNAAYPLNLAHGENIVFLVDTPIRLFASLMPIVKDYWLFDSRDCFILEYDVIGQFLGINKIAPSHTSLYATAMITMLKMSIEIDRARALLGRTT